MKVLNVNMSLDPITGGGTAERTFQLSKFMARKGIACTLLTLDIGLTSHRMEELEGVNLITLPCLNRRYYIPKMSYSFIKGLVKDNDIINIMNHWTLLNAIVYLIARRLKKPYVFCPAGTLSIQYRSIIKFIYNNVIGKKIIRNANRLIAISPNEIPNILNYGVDINRISVIPNGINPKDFEITDNSNFKEKYDLPDCPFLLYVGRLSYIKGPDLLLQAFNRIKDNFKDYHLVFIGPDDGFLPELRKIVIDNGIEDRVHFKGYIGGKDKVLAYQASNLLVIPSRQEAMSIVVIEAGATGTPVLITDHCGFNEIADFNGGLVVEASVEGLTIGLTDLLSNPLKLKSIGENLKKYTYSYFTWEVIIERYLELFREILGQQSTQT